MKERERERETGLFTWCLVPSPTLLNFHLLYIVDGVPPRGTKVVSRLSEKVPLSGRGSSKEGQATTSRIQQALAKPVQQVTAVTVATAPSSQQARQPTAVESGGSLTRQLIGGANPVIESVETMETVRGGGTNLSVAKRSILMSESSSSSDSDSESEKELSIVQHEPSTFKSGKGPGKRGYQKTAKQDHSTGGELHNGYVHANCHFSISVV